MIKTQAFARARAMFAAIAAIMTEHSHDVGSQKAALAQLGPYVSRGKGKGGGNRVARGANMAGIRAARKARNVRRHRARVSRFASSS
jgi:hypothetical protein